MLTLVVDTNILISSLISDKGYSYRVVQAGANGKVKLVSSLPMMEELKDVLTTEDKFLMTSQEADMVVEKFCELINLVDTVNVPTPDVDNQPDHIVLQCAEAAKADYIVTGDLKLQGLKKYKETVVVTPRQMMEIIQQL